MTCTLIKRILLAILLGFATRADAQPPIRVTLLGTGSPAPSIERFGPGLLIEAGGQRLLFDCGRGSAQRIWQLNIPLGKVDALFLTHLHSDHVTGIPDLWLTGWIPAVYGNRKSPFAVWGPAGTKDMMENLVKAFAWDINIRRKEINEADSGILVHATDFSEGFTWEKNGVTVTPFIVPHSDYIDSALGYRVDYAGHTVIVSGDTRYSENLVRHAKGADVIIHEVAAAAGDASRYPPLVTQILSLHTSPEDAGKVFAQAIPRLAVYSHIVLLPAPPLPPPTADDLVLRTRKYYSGPLAVGEDLMRIEIGDSIRVTRHGATSKAGSPTLPGN